MLVRVEVDRHRLAGFASFSLEGAGTRPTWENVLPPIVISFAEDEDRISRNAVVVIPDKEGARGRATAPRY